MDFQVDARIQEYTVAQLEQIILARHGDPIQNLELFKDSPDEANKLASGSEDTVATAGEGATTIFYDYFPPLDPFENRPVAGQLHATNQDLFALLSALTGQDEHADAFMARLLSLNDYAFFCEQMRLGGGVLRASVDDAV